MNSVYEWLRLLCGKSVRLALTSGAVIFLYTGLLYFVDFLWMIYIETPVGQRFLTLNLVDISAIESLRGENFLALSLEVILIVILVCLVFGAVSQVFLLNRYFREGRGFFYRLIIWGIPCVALTSIAISRIYEMGSGASALLGLVPTVVLFNSCLRFTPGLLPEISSVIGGIATLAQKGLEKDRRDEPRYEVSLPLAYNGPRRSGVHKSMAHHFSNHGFCLRDPKDLVNGDIIKFKLKVENDSILGEAKIKWTKDPDATDRKKARSSRSGCRIVSMITEYRSILRDYLSRNSFTEA